MTATNNAAFTKLLNSLQDTHGPNKDSKDIYESVLHRHFQIIQTFLEKINSLYLKNEDLQNNIFAINQKLQKIEASTQNIHYQFRTTHLMIDKRLNSMVTDFNNMNEQIHLIRQDIPIDSYLSTQHFLSKSAHLKSRRNKKSNKDDVSQDSNPYNILINSKNQINQQGQISSVSSNDQKEEKAKQRQRKSKLINMKKLGFQVGRRSQTCKKIIQVKKQKKIQVENNSNSSEQSFQKDNGVSVRIIKTKKDLAQEPIVEEKSGVIYTTQWVQNELNRKLECFKIQFQQKMSLMQGQNAKFKNEVYEKIIQSQSAQIEPKIVAKIEQLRKMHEQQINRLNTQISLLHQKNTEEGKLFQQKFNRKVESQYFEESLTNLSAAISSQMSKYQRYFSNKAETQRAIRFLENKINKLIVEDSPSTLNKNRKDISGVDQPYLKINKCESHKKIDIGTSEKSIKDRVEDLQMQNTVYRSLDSSYADIDIMCSGTIFKEDHKNILQRAISNAISWKSPPLFDPIKHDKPLRNSSINHIKERQSVVNASSQKEKLGVREWREKVVKILNKGDRKKRKVTFR